MRYLNKHINCKRLKQKRKNPPDADDKAKRAWRRFNKKDTRKACFKLQKGLCAYTELSLDSPLGSHLEHIAPRSQHPERTFAADNIVLSVLSDDYAGTLQPTERFGGHYKKSQYAEGWFISPYNPECEEFFEYAAAGHVSPAPHLTEACQKKAQRTIQTLNLNCDYLVTRRYQALSSLEQTLQNILNEQHSESTKASSLEAFANQHLTALDGRLPEFYSARKQLLMKYLCEIREINSGCLPSEPVL